MDTRMLDVGIGLVLVLALLSLIATTVQELWTSWKENRGRNFARLVCSLMGDNKALSEEVLRHPFMMSMAMERSGGKAPRTPSYLPSDVFVTGLLAFLTRYTGNVRPASPAVLVQEIKVEMKDAVPFTDSMAALLPGVEDDWPAFEKRLQGWFDAVGERASGWYKRENQVSLLIIGSLLAISLNVNPIVIAGALWNDADLRKAAVEQAELTLQSRNGTQGAAAANPDAPVSSKNIGDFYRETDAALADVRRLAGTIDEETPSGKPDAMTAARDADNMKTFLAQERQASGNDAKQTADRDAATIQFDNASEALHRLLPKNGAPETNCGEAGQAECTSMQQLGLGLAKLDKAVAGERAVRHLRHGGRIDAAYFARQCQSVEKPTQAMSTLCTQLQQFGMLSTMGIPLGWGEDSLPLFKKCLAGKPCEWELASLKDFPGKWVIALLGWTITAVGVVLGAPFWFDLLGKFMKLRGSGVKPVEGSTAAAETLPTAPAPAPSTLAPSSQAAADGVRPASRDALNDAERSLTEDEITRIQRNLGLSPTEQTGRLDLKTRSAITVWQARYGAVTTGELTQAQIQQLLINPMSMEEDGYVG